MPKPNYTLKLLYFKVIDANSIHLNVIMTLPILGKQLYGALTLQLELDVDLASNDKLSIYEIIPFCR
jgi:hypothetical protein